MNAWEVGLKRGIWIWGLVFWGAWAGSSWAVQEVEIVIRDHQFHPESVHVRAGEPIRLVVKNEDRSVEEFESHDLRLERIIRPGGKAIFRIRALKPGKYEFFGEFHPDTARGWLVVE